MGRESLVSILWFTLCAPVFTAVCFKDVLIVGSELLQCLGFSEAHVPSGTFCHFLQLFAEPLFPSWLRLLVIDGSGPYGWLAVRVL